MCGGVATRAADPTSNNHIFVCDTSVVHGLLICSLAQLGVVCEPWCPHGMEEQGRIQIPPPPFIMEPFSDHSSHKLIVGGAI